MGQAASSAADPYTFDYIEDTVFTPLPRCGVHYNRHPYFTQDFFRRQANQEAEGVGFPGNDGGYKAAGSFDDDAFLEPIGDAREDGVVDEAPGAKDSGVESGSVRVRLESDSTITGGNNSSLTDHSVPAITITECSDTDTDFEFMPSATSERKDEVLFVPSDPTVTADMDAPLIRHEDSVLHRRSAGGGGSKVTAEVTTKPFKSHKGIFRRKKSSGSDSSFHSSHSSKSSKSAGVIRKKHKRKDFENKKRKSMFAARGSMNDKWQNIVDEYQGVYLEEKPERNHTESNIKKLSPERYDSVKQVFGRGIPLAHQTAPPGAKAADIEQSSGGQLAMSRYNATTSLARTHDNRPITPTKHRTNNPKVVAGRKYTNHEVTQGVIAKSFPTVSHSERGLESQKAHSKSSSGHREHHESHQQIAQKKTSDSSKKGVKFHQHLNELEDEAQVIVDDAVEAALRLLYGAPHSSTGHSHQSSSSAHHQSSSSSQSHKTDSSRYGSAEQRMLMHSELHDLNTVEHHYHHRHKGSNHSRHADMVGSANAWAISDVRGRSSGALPPPMTKQLALTSSKESKVHQGEFYEIGIEPYSKQQTNKKETAKEHVIVNRTNKPVNRLSEKFGDKSVNVMPTSKIQIKNDSNIPAQPPVSPPIQEPTKQTTKPPTLSRGTVTKVMHKSTLNKQSGLVMLEELKDIDEEKFTSSTWPLERPGNYTVTTEIQSNTSYNTLPLTSKHYDGDSTVSYCMENAWLTRQVGGSPMLASPQGREDQKPVAITAALRHQTDQGMPYASDTMASGSTFVHGSGSSLQPAALVTMAPTQQPNILPLGGSARYQIYGTAIHPTMDIPSPKSLHELEGGAYSNEPVIIADLLDKVETSSNTQDAKSLSPTVNMDKQSIINFYVFNHDRRAGDVDVENASKHFQPSSDYNVQYHSDIYRSERSSPVRRHEFRDYIIEADDFDTDSQELREETIYHKQTQTLPPPRPKKTQRNHTKKAMTLQRYQPRITTPQPNLSRETTHYITKERQIEKIPTTPPPVHACDFSTQTDISGTLSKYTGSKTSKQLRTPKSVDAVNVTREISPPKITETRQLESHYRAPSLPSSSAGEVEDSGREIPIHVQQPTRPTLQEMLHQELVTQHQQSQYQSLPLVEDIGPEESESEEEIIETIEIEEREQRLTMAIFEELEFHLERSQGASKEGHKSSGSELVPWLFPDRYDATVDRRREKSLQIREINKEAGQSRQSSGPGASAKFMLRENQKAVVDALEKAIGDEQSNEESLEVDGHASLYQHHHNKEQNHAITASSSGYSSPDNFQTHRQTHVSRQSKCATSREAGSGSPDVNSQRKRHVSMFDPENIYYTVPEWTSLDKEASMLNLSTQREDMTVKKSVADEESLPDSLPGNPSTLLPAHHIEKTTASQAEPKVSTSIIKDEDGNVMKVTEVEHTMTKTVDYKQDAVSYMPTAGLEELGGTQYLDMNLLAAPDVDPEPSESVASDPPQLGPEVVAETSTKLTAVEYSEQTRTIGLDEEDIKLKLRLREGEEQERSMGIGDEDGGTFAPSQFLYDMRTATLRPQITQDPGAMRRQPHQYRDMSTKLWGGANLFHWHLGLVSVWISSFQI